MTDYNKTPHGLLTPRMGRDDSRIRNELQKTFTQHDLVSDQLIYDPIGTLAKNIKVSHIDLYELEKELWGLLKKASMYENPKEAEAIFNLFSLGNSIRNIITHVTDYSVFDVLRDPYFLSFCIPLSYQKNLINDFKVQKDNQSVSSSDSTTFWATIIHILDVRPTKGHIGAFQLGIIPEFERILRAPNSYTQVMSFLSKYPIKLELRFTTELLANILDSDKDSKRRKDLLELKYLQIISGQNLDMELFKKKMPFLVKNKMFD